jgi:hypothetical protein
MFMWNLTHTLLKYIVIESNYGSNNFKLSVKGACFSRETDYVGYCEI